MPGLRRIGRNDPCPCGSGRKYKQCCLRREEAFLHAKTAGNNLATELVRCARLERVAPSVDRAWQRFWPAEPPLPLEEALQAAGQGEDANDIFGFLDWLLHDAVLDELPADVPLRRSEGAHGAAGAAGTDDPVGTAAAAAGAGAADAGQAPVPPVLEGAPVEDPGPTLLDVYCAMVPERDLAPDGTAGRLVAAWRRSVPSAFEVTAAEPGRAVWLRDVFTDEVFEVWDAGVSGDVQSGEVLIVRLRPLEGVYEAAGEGWRLQAGDVTRLRAWGERQLAALREVEPGAGWRRLWRVRGELLHHFVAELAQEADRAGAADGPAQAPGDPAASSGARAAAPAPAAPPEAPAATPEVGATETA